ncbi:MAG: DUF4837 family protein [Bacteroidales bacterium]|jgi:hypothetical protein|nr:DUF4837 family protein [Bacteroidales bacterium]
MNKIFFTAWVVFLLLCLTNCGHKKGITVKVDHFSNGKAGEVLLVIDKDLWDEQDLASIRAPLIAPQPGLNQVEPMFDLLVLNNRDFTSQFQRHRGIVRFDMDKNYGSNSLTLAHDTWANPQVYVYAKGNHPDSLIALYQKHQKEIITELYNNDLKRLQRNAIAHENPVVEQLIETKFGIRLSIPREYVVAREDSNFLWLRFRTIKNDRFVMIYRTTSSSLCADSVLLCRDRMTRAYIPGAVNGAYPILSRHDGFPIVYEDTLGYKTGLSARGLWESVNDKMGGPFYSFTFIDASRQKTLSVDGFVYAPQENKRDYLREVESIVKSIK